MATEKANATTAVATTAATTTQPAKRTATAVAPAGKPKVTIEALLTGEKFTEKITALLPTYLKPATFVQICCTQLKKVPLLAKCEPVSFFAKLQECAERGLAPNGRDAYMIPFKNNRTGEYEVQLIIGYQGKVKLAKKYGGVKRIYCELWCKGDTLTNDTGIIHHIIDYTKPRNEATALGVVCIVFFEGDTIGQGVVVPTAEINAVRDNAKSYRQAQQFGGDCPWMSYWGEMAKKTAFNKLCKWLDLSPEFEAAAEVDDDVIDAEYTEGVAAGAMPAPRMIAGDQPKALPNASVAETGAFTEGQQEAEPEPAEVF